MKVALQFDEPWDGTEDVAGKWWRGVLSADGWVELDEVLPFRGHEHRRVNVTARYVGDEVVRLGANETIIVNQMVTTSGEKQMLIGSLKRLG